jgi:hypothetical protein
VGHDLLAGHKFLWLVHRLPPPALAWIALITWLSLNSLLPPSLTDGMLPSWTLRFHVFMDGRDVSVKMRDIISSAVISRMFACTFLGSPEQIQGINTG